MSLNKNNQPINPEELLQTVSSYEFYFTKAQDNADSQDGDPAEDHEVLQKLFASRKNIFFALETKAEVLKALNSNDEFDSITPASTEQLSVDVFRSKNELIALKREIDTLKNTLRDAIKDTMRKCIEMAQSRDNFEKVRFRTLVFEFSLRFTTKMIYYIHFFEIIFVSHNLITLLDIHVHFHRFTIHSPTKNGNKNSTF